MRFNVNQKDLQEALSYCQGVIEKRSTLQILSNVLLDANNSTLTITATDLDLIFVHQINNVEILEQGKTTTTSSIMFDIVRKFSSDKNCTLATRDSSVGSKSASSLGEVGTVTIEGGLGTKS